MTVGGSPPNLINTCSYPSSSPTSDPSDCVLIPRDAFIRIVKTASPNIGSFPFKLAQTLDAFPTAATFTATAPSAMTSAFIPIRSDGTSTYKLKEDVPANWAISGTPSCTGATGTGSSNGTFSGDTISGINASPDNQITCTFNDVQLTGAIRILKQRLDATPAVPLAGAHFAISSGGTVVSGASDLVTAGTTGSVCKDGLPLGSYSVNETQAPDGHRVDTTNPRTVSVTSAGTCTSGATDVTFDNALVLGTINITKTSGGAALAGAVFTLYTNNDPFTSPRGPDTAAGDPVTTYTCTSTATLTATGNCTIANIPLGRYWLVETPPSGYIGAVDSEVTIAVGTSPGTGTVLNIPITNQAAAGSITISKTGYGGAALAGAVFRLYHRTTEAFLGSLPTSHDPCTTNAAGTCTIADVAPGDYWVVETSAPPGYTVAAPVAATVPLGSGAGVGADITVGPISDPVVPGTVTIHKTGIDDSLPGATFTLYTNNAPLTGARDEGGADPITTHTCTTNADGDCSMTSVPLGHYWVVETVTPNGYDTAPEQTVNVGVGTVSEGVGDVDSLTFADPVVPGTVVITKRDDAQNLLDGAVFKLYTNNAPTGGPRGDSAADPATTKTCTTGSTSAGKCTITGVALGDYWIVEESAPNSHYVLAADRAITVGLGTVAAHVGDVVDAADFIDERKHRVVVLVCHEGTDTLFQRNVTLGGGAPKLSLGAGSLSEAQQKALCDTGGASFGDIAGHGDVSPVVHLDAPAAP